MALTHFSSSSFPVKVHLKKKIRRPKNSTVIDRDRNYLSITVEFFFIAVFLEVNFYGRSPGTDLHHTVSMVRLPDPDLLIFPSTCNDNLVPGSFRK
jgi:hypothetical protein